MGQEGRKSGSIVLTGAFGLAAALLGGVISGIISGGIADRQIEANWQVVLEQQRREDCRAALAALVEHDPTGELIGNDEFDAVDLMATQARRNCDAEEIAILEEVKRVTEGNPQLEQAIAAGLVRLELRANPTTGADELFAVPKAEFETPPLFPGIREPILILP